jgi:hypothetical protein
MWVVRFINMWNKMHQWTNFNFSKLHSWYYDMFSFKLMICCYYVAFTLQLFFPTPTLKASGLVLIHVCFWMYVLFFLLLCALNYVASIDICSTCSFVISLLYAICTLGYRKVETSHHIWLFEWKSMKVFELLCLSIATIWMKLNVIIWIHRWMKLNVMYIHWVKLICCITSNFGYSKIFRIKEPMVFSKILKEPSLFSQNKEQITFPSFIKAYLTIS